MKHIEGIDRNQLTLMPDAIEDYISEDNPVRFLDAYVDHLDLKDLGFPHVVPEERGRPPYHPGVLLRLYLYGYLFAIRSSRALEREANRNLEVIWLLKRLAPDFKTIADFRKINGKAIRNLCREFVHFGKREGLFGGELVALDGSKFKASNARDRNFSRAKLKDRLKKIDEKIDRYLQELDENDEKESGFPKKSAEELREIIDHLKKRKKDLKRIDKQMKKTGASQVSLTDPDSRSMPIGRGRHTEVAYNVQMTVDDKHKLILDHEVTNDVTDQGHLEDMSLRAKKILGAKKFDMLTDMGYYDGQQVAVCLEEGITPWISRPNTSVNRKKGLFTKNDFRYIKRSDCYICPAGKRLTFSFQGHELGRDIRYYATSECSRCSKRPQCTRKKSGGRRITRLAEEWALDEMERRNRLHPEKLKRRKEIVEHPFGTMKHSMNQGYFLMRGLNKVKTEMSLTVTAYNIKRVINILGVKRMVQALA
jgi:transposase